MPTLQRFSPQTASLDEAYDRATRTPRDVAQLACTLLAWELSNLVHDCASPVGDLPRRFGFEAGNSFGAPLAESPYHTSIAPAARLYVTDRRIVCAHSFGSVILSSSAFDFQHSDFCAGSDTGQLPDKGARPVTPQQWMIGWACLARAFALFSKYERWVVATAGQRYRYDGESQRPKAARRSPVPLLQFPEALDSIAEWCSDGEKAMLTYIVSDARQRRIEPEIPKL